ncbi:hypothetical protein HYY71_04970, partial [Candidatus Woesearchaeota archaeon]|nr:hypothetical protein [Candidatus Woesearchaeota archaeon]
YVLREKEQIGKDLAFQFAIKGKDTVGKEVLRYANSFGCCTSKTDGVCFKNTNPSKCAGNVYNSDLNCECQSNLKSEAEGCCVSGSNMDKCDLTTEGQCRTTNGQFYKNDFRCSKSRCSNWDCKSTYNYVKDDFSGQAKRHGESWCSYESIAGRGLDYVGTRHYLHSCIRGKEYAEECRDFREELCAEGFIGVYDKLYSKGLCRLNRWYDCSQQKDKASCEDEEHRDCYWFEGLNSQLKCHPEVPPGLKFWEPNANEICNTASLDKDDEGKKYPRSWGHSALLYCQRTGDCGNYRNYADEITTFGYYNRDGTPEQWAYLDNGYVERGDEFAVKLSLYSNYISDSASIPKVASGKYARCDLWQAPAFGNCELCMNSKLHPCTEYRCKSLGRNCNFDSVTNKCYHGASSAGSSRPNLSITLQGELNSRNTASDYYANATEHAVESVIPVHKPFNFNFRTSKPTRCKISLYPPNVNPNSFSNLIVSLPEILLNDYEYKQDYNVTIRFPSSQFTRLSTYKMFIRCEDQLGIRNDESIFVVRTTELINDTEAPEIIEVRAQSPLARNSNDAFSIFANEPFDRCKYYFNEADYLNMTDIGCSSEEKDIIYNIDYPLGSYICNAEVFVPEDFSRIYFSCEDKAGNRNENYEYA